MSGLSRSANNNQVTSCVACGGSIVQAVGVNGEFCSSECYRVGRSFCKQCGNLLPPSKKPGWKRSFCNNLCEERFSRRMSVSSSFLEEKYRSTCKACGKLIISKRGTRQFCNNNGKCCHRYHTTNRQQNSLEEWGAYAPETRKILRELQDMKLMGTAKRLAVAVDREYILRNRNDPRNIRGGFITCICKTCGTQFQRRPWGNQSRDYCNKRSCRPSGRNRGEAHVFAKLTWEQVDEIRDLRATRHITERALAEKYGVSKSSIQAILRRKTWKPENDPRRKVPLARED